MASTRGAAPNDDSDLEDLLAKTSSANSGSGNRSQAANNGASGGGVMMSPLACCTGSIRLFCYTFPRLSKCIMLLSILGVLGFLSNTIFNSTAPMGIMGADYSAINSAFDLSLAKVDHWCIKGDNESCKCEDPLEPTARSEFKSWSAAHKANVADVNMYRALYGSEPTKIDVSTGKPRPAIDVAFVGESVVEAMDGRWLGKKVVKAINSKKDNEKEGPEEKQKPDLGKTFDRLFRKDNGGPVEGVALGIAGDNTANVLWRLQNDEMPYDFNPKVWWLVLGMNDLTRMQCSEEIVVLGILRVIEEIRMRKPDAHIVVNSLLPMIEFQSIEEPKMADVVDFKTGGDNMKKNIEIEKAVKEYVGNAPPPPPPPVKGTEKAGRPGGRHLRSEPKKMTKKQKLWVEDHATEGPALEKAMARAKKSLEKTDKRLVNKMFSDTEKFHPKKGVIPFLPIIKKSVLPPVWPAVHLINDKLKEFCSKHDSITFFDATPIFASDEGRGRHHLHNELISPRGHPSDLGFAVWEGQIIGRLRKLIAEKEEEMKAKKAALPPQMMNDDGFQSDDAMGIEHVSDGKIAQPPPIPMAPPPRSDPTTEAMEDGREHVSGGKTAVLPPEPKEPPPRASPTEKEEESDDDDNVDDKVKGKKSAAVAKKEEKAVKNDENDDGDDDDDDDNVDDKVEVKKSASVAKKETKAAKKKDNDDDDKKDEVEENDDGDDDDNVDDKVEVKKSFSVAKKGTKEKKDDDDDDEEEVEDEEEEDDDDDDDDDNLHQGEEEESSAPIAEEEEESASAPQFHKATTEAKKEEDDDV